MARHALCEKFVGREGPRRVLTSNLEAAAAGEGRILLVGGDAGIGKTRICHELRHEAAARKLRVIEGRCSAAETGVPLGPFMDALRFRLAHGEGTAAVRILGPLLDQLAPLFPELESAATSASEANPSGEGVFERIFEVIERLSALDPLLFIIEDLHWADSTSLELIHYLSGRIRRTRALLLITYRSDEVLARPEVRSLLASLARERRVREVCLLPLSDREVDEMIRCMLGEDVDPTVAEAVNRRSYGNPFFVEELLMSISDGQKLSRPGNGEAALRAGPLPSSIRELMLGRFSMLGESASSAMAAASVLGRSFTFELLEATTGIDEASLLNTVEKLIENHVLVEVATPKGDRYAFRHPLTREVAYGSLIARKRRMLHRRVAEAIESQAEAGDAPTYDALAYHFRMAGDLPLARKYSTLAGELAAGLHAWEDAAAHFETALMALEESGGGAGEQADLLEKLMEVAWWKGGAELAWKYGGEALALRETAGDAMKRAVLLRRMAQLQVDEHSDLDRAATRLLEALAVLVDAPQRGEAAMALNDLGRIHLAQGEFGKAEAALARGLAMAMEASHAEEALALAVLGQLSIRRGKIAIGSSRLDVALELSKDDPLPLDRAATLYNTAIRTLVRAREDARAREWVAEASARMEAEGEHALVSLYKAYGAALEEGPGTGEAILTIRQAVDELRLARRPEIRDALRLLGNIYRLHGEVEAARRAYEESTALGDQSAELGMALLELATGNAGDACKTFQRFLESRNPGDLLSRLRLLPLQAEACLALGNSAGAEDAVRELERAVPESDFVAGPASLAFTVAIQQAAAGDFGAARESFQTSLHAWEQMGDRREAARTKLAWASASILSGDSEAGIPLARSALEMFGSMDAKLEIAKARFLLRSVGIRVRSSNANESRRSGTNSAGRPLLTRREKMILAELVKGSTNREIGAALGIAEKTVSVHLTHIFSKLGCHTRTQAAAMARTFGAT